MSSDDDIVVIKVEFFGGPKDGYYAEIPGEHFDADGMYQVVDRFPPQLGDDCWMYQLTDIMIRPDVYRCKIVGHGKVIQIQNGE